MSGKKVATPSKPPLSLFSLPEEVLIAIFRYLPPKTLGRLMWVCRRLRRLGGDPLLWKDHLRRHFSLQGLQLASHQAGFVLGAHQPLPPFLNTTCPQHFRSLFVDFHQRRRNPFPQIAGLINRLQRGRPVEGWNLADIDYALGLSNPGVTLEAVIERLTQYDAENQNLLDYATDQQDFLNAIYHAAEQHQLFKKVSSVFGGLRHWLKFTFAALTHQISVVTQEEGPRLVTLSVEGTLQFKTESFPRELIYNEACYDRLIEIASRYGNLDVFLLLPIDGMKLRQLILPGEPNMPVNQVSYTKHYTDTAQTPEVLPLCRMPQKSLDFLFHKLQTMTCEDHPQRPHLLEGFDSVSDLLFFVGCCANQMTYLEAHLKTDLLSKKQALALLRKSVAHGATDAVSLLVEACEITQTDDTEVLLHRAAYLGHYAIAHYLITKNWNVNKISRRHDFTTPLHQAATHAHLNIVLLLLHHGANVHACDRRKQSPLYNAATSDGHGALRAQIVKLLYQRGGQRETNGSELLNYAMRMGSVEVMRFLLTKITPTEDTLRWAFVHLRPESVELLLQHDRDLPCPADAVKMLFSREYCKPKYRGKVQAIVENLFEAGSLHRIPFEAFPELIDYLANNMQNSGIVHVLYRLLARAQMSLEHDVYQAYETCWAQGGTLKEKITRLLEPYSEYRPEGYESCDLLRAFHLSHSLENTPDDPDKLLSLVQRYLTIPTGTADKGVVSTLTFMIEKLEAEKEAAALEATEASGPAELPEEPTRTLTLAELAN